MQILVEKKCRVSPHVEPWVGSPITRFLYTRLSSSIIFEITTGLTGSFDYFQKITKSRLLV
jgi:hypothetical protein